MNPALLSPCGMYCGFCGSYLALKNNIPRRRGIITHCAGCRPRGKQCSFLLKRCAKLRMKKIEFCSECDSYPCQNLQHIATKYRTQYYYSYDFFAHLQQVSNLGVLETIKQIHQDHTCERCGEILCIHNGLCYHCDREILATMKNYRNE